MERHRESMRFLEKAKVQDTPPPPKKNLVKYVCEGEKKKNNAYESKRISKKF